MKGEKQPQPSPDSHLEQDICIHIFTVSSAMVGVCLTVIGLIRVVITLGTADTLADDFPGRRRAAVSDFLSAFLLGATLARTPQNASPRKNRRCHIYHRHDRDGRGLCVGHIYDFYSTQVVCHLEHVLELPLITVTDVGYRGGVGRGAGVGRDLGVGVGLGVGTTQALKKIGSWLAKGRPKGTPFPVKAP
jgi:hypothetical protein